MRPPAPGTIEVHLVRPDDVPAALTDRYLDSAERERAAAFRFPEHADQWKRFRTALRTTLAGYLGCDPQDVALATGEHGKPMLPLSPSLHFNLTHTRDLALIAISTDGPVGIDVEPTSRARDLPECASSFCHPAELAALPLELDARQADLLRIWTAKEAGAKAAGTGFSVSPCDLQVTTDSVIDATGREWPLIRLEHPGLSGHLAHLCALQKPAAVRILDRPAAYRMTARTS
ncbi:4'-phosphopantetheinyl transferase superfamily protein [Luteolibacter sp. LG18]|uniref:4'-phosphopantetheinyl transferase family protein n=1 Tax=Luteolibacter sp. LG18 TaxID=2819286 RepID=UPI002B2F4A20|nr:hypothetical protein llg_02720 [Luteolibacter sp. LG18]